MITHEELLSIGFEVKGIKDKDTFYQLFFGPPILLGIDNFSGAFDEESGKFEIWGLKRELETIEDIKEIIRVLGLKKYKRK